MAYHARELTPAHMGYGDPAGLPRLRTAVADHLRIARAVRCEPRQVIIVSGSQAALRLCAAVLLRRGDRVAVEDPGYGGAHAALTATGADLVPVPVDDDGLDVDRLVRTRATPRACYVTPTHQYPLGSSMSAAPRMALVDWAVREHSWIIEDDYDSEFRYVSRPLGALQGMGDHAAERVLYVGTFSKVLFPALRVGYLVVPRPLIDEFVAAREVMDLFSPTLYQLALATFIHEGHFARHVRRMRGVYRDRRAALLDGLTRHCDGLLALHNADAGLHAATLLPRGVDDVAVVSMMKARGLTANALSTCYLTEAAQSGLLLGFAGVNATTLAAATHALGEVLRSVKR